MQIIGRARTPLCLSAALLVVQAAVCIAAGSGTFAADWQARVAPRVMLSIDARQRAVATAKASPATARFDAKQRLQIDIAYDCDSEAPQAALEAAGLVIGTALHAEPMCVVEGWAASSMLPTVASVAHVRFVDLPHYAKAPRPMALRGRTRAAFHATPQSAVGTAVIDGNGITIMNADRYIAQSGVNGAGVSVGVINSDATHLSVIQSRNELPAVTVVQPSAHPTPVSDPSDEGTMMLEEVYAVAPGAGLSFCGPQTYVEYVACVQALIAGGVTVITDDLQFPGLDIMTAPAQNADAQVIQNMLTVNPAVMLFSSAENDALNYWQGPYQPVKPAKSSTLSCQGQTDRYFEAFTGSTLNNIWSLDGQNESASDLLLAWPSAAGVNSSNYDLYVVNKTTLSIIACAAGSSAATGANTFTAGGTTYGVIEAGSLTSLSAGHAYAIMIGTPDQTLAGGFLKLIGAGDGADLWSTLAAGSTTSPQDFATGAYPIGAVDGGDGIGNSIEFYSATGPIQFELPTASTRQAPVVVAPDDIYVDNVGTDFASDMFSGTSAASPNSAAVVALLSSAFPALTAAQLMGYMESGAAPLPSATSAVPNGTYGYGRVDALGALTAMPAPGIAVISPVSIVGGASANVPLALTGTGTLTLTTSSDTAALIASGTPGVTLSPSGCGATTLTCSLLVTPTVGQSGAANITVSVVDGAKRSATATFTVTVTKPAAPTISITAGAAQTFTEGAKATPVSFAVTGTQFLTVTAVSNDTALLPASGIVLTSGCGTAAVLNCIAALTVVAGQSGNSTVAITVTDPYFQTASGAATVTVNAPAKSGGGSIDPGFLLTIGALILARSARRHCATR